MADGNMQSVNTGDKLRQVDGKVVSGRQSVTGIFQAPAQEWQMKNYHRTGKGKAKRRTANGQGW